MSSNSSLARFLGGNPVSVIVKLAIISLFVGAIMAAFGWTPFGILQAILDFFAGIWNLGFGALEKFGSYILLGAAVVVPIFLLSRLLNTGSRR